MMKSFASSRPVRVLLAISATALLAACSSDIERLSDYPPVDNTASVAPQKVQSKPLPPVAGNSASPWSTPTPSWARNGGYAAPVRRAARNTYQPPAPARAASYQPPRAASGSVVVQPGQTLFSIARANGKTVSELMAANGLSSPAIKVGQRITIPGIANPVSPAPTVVHRTASAAPAVSQPRVRPAAAPARPVTNARAASARTHRVQPGETWFALGRKYGVHPRKIAAYNGLTLRNGLKVGQVVKIPASQGWRMRGGATTVARAPETPARAAAPAPRRVAKATPVARPKDEARITVDERKTGATPAPRLSAARFAWPVQGRVIAGFGQKIGGARNEGINIAAPEGTPVRAAADGVVAYAGNELKDYGNLVLIRHAGGWVTAYAHNRELKVKRGDHVKKGQIIASVGKTGAVKSAQLHFEVRKGATPVNPRAQLGTATAMR